MAETSTNKSKKKTLSNADKWILSRTNKLLKDVTKALETFHYSEAGQKIFDFTRQEFCDWYLELSKGAKQNTKVLRDVLEILITLLHPFIPYVTEVLWEELGYSKIKGKSLLLISQTWPKENKTWEHKEAEKNIDLLINTITAIRSIRADKKIEPVKKIEANLYINKSIKKFIDEAKEEIIKLARLEKLNISTAKAKSGKGLINKIISKELTVSIPLSGMIDINKEKQRLNKELVATVMQLESLDKRLSNKGYMEKAPKNLIDQTMNDKKEVQEKIKKLEKEIKAL